MAKSKYRNDFPDRARKYAEQGLNDESIAANLDISLATYYKYQNRYKEFLDAIKEGKRNPNEEVENALYKRALGFVHTYTRQKVLSDGSIVEYEESVYYPPSETAGIFWSVNRQPDRWRSINKDKINENRPQTVGFKFKVVNEDDES